VIKVITLSFVDKSRLTPTFFVERGRGCRFSGVFFPIFDVLIRSRDIRDQSRQLSKIAQNFGRFFGRHKFLGQGLIKIVITPASPDVD